MKTDNPNITDFPINFNSNNTFILKKNEDNSDKVLSLIEKLDSQGKTVVITDNFLFPNDNSEDYRILLHDFLKKFKANKIIYCCRGLQNNTLFSDVKEELASHNCQLQCFITNDYHDRYWVCTDSEKGINIGTSLNGIGYKTTTIKYLDSEEITDLKESFLQAGII